MSRDDNKNATRAHPPDANIDIHNRSVKQDHMREAGSVCASGIHTATGPDYFLKHEPTGPSHGELQSGVN